MSMWESRQPIHQQAECSSVFSTRQWQILIWFYFSILVILHVLLNPSWSSNCIQLRQNRAKSISNPVKADSILVPPLLPSLSIKKRKSGTTRLASKKDVPCGKPNGTKAFHPTGNVFGVVFGFFLTTSRLAMHLFGFLLHMSNQLVRSLFPAHSDQNSVWSSCAVAHLITAIWFSAFRKHEGSVLSYLQNSEIPTDCPCTMNPQEE